MASYITVDPQPFGPAQYGDNMNWLQQQTIPAIQAYWTNLNTNINNIDPQNPASLLQVQFLMSEYENAVQRTIEQNPQALAGALKSAEAQTNAADGPSWDAVLADVTKVADEIRQVGHHPAAGTPSHLHPARPMLRV